MFFIINFFVFLPSNFLKSPAKKSPRPGLLTQIFFFDNFSPLFIFFIETTDANAKFAVFFSILDIFLFDPFEKYTISALFFKKNSYFESIEQIISGPFLCLLSVKCFSIMQAPLANAEIHGVIPIE